MLPGHVAKQVLLASGLLLTSYIFCRGLLGVAYDFSGWVLKTFFGYEDEKGD